MGSGEGAEGRTLSSCAHELVAVRNQMRELGFQLGAATVLRGDNTASVMAANQEPWSASLGASAFGATCVCGARFGEGEAGGVVVVFDG